MTSTVLTFVYSGSTPRFPEEWCNVLRVRTVLGPSLSIASGSKVHRPRTTRDSRSPSELDRGNEGGPHSRRHRYSWLWVSVRTVGSRAAYVGPTAPLSLPHREEKSKIKLLKESLQRTRTIKKFVSQDGPTPTDYRSGSLSLHVPNGTPGHTFSLIW